MLTLVKKLRRKICKNIKIFLHKVVLQIGLKKFLWLEKLKILFYGHMLLMLLIENKLLELFTKKLAKNKSERV